MNRPLPVTAASLVALVTLVALAGCGLSQPGSVPSPASPSNAVTASASATAATSPPALASPGTQAAGSAGVQDVSFVSADHGWALGSGELFTTTDGGVSWTRLPGPPAGAAHIRFASPQVGYAWTATGSLWITTNGAASWQPGGLAQVVSLETAAGWVWSIAGPQPYPGIWRAAVGSTAWTDLGLTPDRSATLTVHGDVAYVVGQQGAGPIAPSLDVFTGTQPVRHEALPCGQGQAYVPFAPLGVSTNGLVYLVCDVMNNQPSPPAQTQLAYQSASQGSSWSADDPPPPQPAQGVTAVAGERFAWTFGPDLYRRTGHVWHLSLTDPGHRFSLVGFETNTQGVALGTNGYLWITRNGGTSWNRVTL
jgi:predicted small lipoprotein YifL